MPAVPVNAAEDCTAPRDLVALKRPLPALLASVKARKPIKIVALGSSSTRGTGASNRQRSYPSRLEQELRAAWPDRDVQVVNAGVNGQLAADMLLRIDRDVLAHKPQLVIWQTGVNDLIRGVPPQTFESQLRTGIERLRAGGADVMLLDQQYYPRFEKLKNGRAYLAAMRQTAEQMQVPMMQRFRIMQHLIASAQFTMDTMLSTDQFHLNDRSYACIGHLLAESLSSAVARSPTLPGSHQQAF
jgi:acyl-CoA thioesterase I